MTGGAGPPRPPAVRVYGAAPEAGDPLLTGLIVGVLLAIVWVVVVYVTHNAVGIAAWGVGGLVGVAVARAARPPSERTAMIAALVTLGTVLLANVLILVVALRPVAEDEMMANTEAVTAAFTVDMLQRHSFSPELQAAVDSERAHGHDTTRVEARMELVERMAREAEARARAASHEERARVVRPKVDSVLAHLRFWWTFGKMFGLLDLLWIGLGVSTAWKLGQGIG